MYLYISLETKHPSPVYITTDSPQFQIHTHKIVYIQCAVVYICGKACLNFWSAHLYWYMCNFQPQSNSILYHPLPFYVSVCIRICVSMCQCVCVRSSPRIYMAHALFPNVKQDSVFFIRPHRANQFLRPLSASARSKAQIV